MTRQPGTSMITQNKEITLTPEQIVQVEQMVRWNPFRPIVFGALHPETKEFQLHACFTKHKMNRLMREGWAIFQAQK